MSEPAGEQQGAEEQKTRKTRSDKGTTRSGKRAHVSTRFQRRAEKAKETVRELVRIRMPELDVSELSFVETIDRDADAWGDFLAQLGEWFVPFGTFLDLVFGVGLIRMLRIAPSVRAGRRELAERRERINAARQEEAEKETLRESVELAQQEAAQRGVFAEQPPEQETPQGMTREEWLANGGAAA